MAVDPAGTGPTGLLAVPEDITRAGWWVGSTRLGDRFGSIVLAAHVDSFTQGVGPMAELLSVRPGDTVRVTGGRLRLRFRVGSVTSVPRVRLPERSRLFSPYGDLRLVLITCGGPYEPERGYRDNVVVVATPTGVRPDAGALYGRRRPE